MERQKHCSSQVKELDVTLKHYSYYSELQSFYWKDLRYIVCFAEIEIPDGLTYCAKPVLQYLRLKKQQKKRVILAEKRQ